MKENQWNLKNAENLKKLDTKCLKDVALHYDVDLNKDKNKMVREITGVDIKNEKEKEKKKKTQEAEEKKKKTKE